MITLPLYVKKGGEVVKTVQVPAVLALFLGPIFLAVFMVGMALIASYMTFAFVGLVLMTLVDEVATKGKRWVRRLRRKH